MSYPLSTDFQLRFEDLRVVARGLNRPECVIALADGNLVASYGKGGYSTVDVASGSVGHVVARGDRSYMPNGICVAPNGRVLFADLGGALNGGIYEIDGQGGVTARVESVQGEALPPSNYVMADSAGRIWFTVSTRQRPRSLAWTSEVRDGFIGVLDASGARIVADDLGFTNEIAISADGRWMYVNETYAQCLSRFPLLPNGELGAKEVVAQLGGADLPDGLTLDEHGGVWLTCIASNRILLVRPNGDVQVVLDDSDPAHVAAVVEGIRSRSMPHATMQTAGKSRLANVSSLAFGGETNRVAYLGCLLDDCIRAFDCPVAGLKTANRSRYLGR
jgi:sugar lactone lactonase YvrE